MASTNQSPKYFAAEKKYLGAETLQDKLHWLNEMIRNFKKHKSSEKMLAELKTRRIRLQKKIIKIKKSKKPSKKSIKKEDMQAVLIGLTNSGKSFILSRLTNAQPEIAGYKFTTKSPIIGTINYENVKIQLIDQPAVNYENFDQGITNTADLLIIVITNYAQLEEIIPFLEKAKGGKLIIFNKTDLLNEKEKIKLESKLKSKKLNFILFSAKKATEIQIMELKNKIFQQFDILRVYTKEPRKQKSSIPIIFKKHATIKDVADKIYKGLINHIKEIRIWGPSSKFPGQKVGLKHELKDLDVVEFKVR